MAWPRGKRQLDTVAGLPSNRRMVSAAVSFEALAERVLAGEIAVETASGVPPWPSSGKAKGGCVAVFLHRDAPGVLVVVGFVKKRIVLTSCFSDALRSHCAEFYSADFNFELSRAPNEALRFVMSSVSESLFERDSVLDEAFKWVCGAEAAQLLRELKRVHFPSANEVLH